MTQTSHVMGLHVYMICIQMCQVSKVHNCLENGKIIRVHICNGFSIPFFSLLNTEKKLKKYIASKMYFLFFLLFLRLWNMSFITSRGSSSRVLHYQSKIHTERCCEFQEIKQSMVGRGSGWFLSGCLWVSPTSHLAVGGTNASNGVLLGWRGVAERLVCHSYNIPSADLSLPCGCKTSRTCSPTLSPAHSYAFSQWASWKQNKRGGRGRRSLFALSWRAGAPCPALYFICNFWCV